MSLNEDQGKSESIINIDSNQPLSPNSEILYLLEPQNLFSWYHLPIVYILKLCKVNKQTQEICNRPDFWSTWFITNGIPANINVGKEGYMSVASTLSNLRFGSIIQSIRNSLMGKGKFAIPFFQAFVSNPNFLFPGIEYFISKATALDHAISLGDEEMVNYYVNLLNSGNVIFFDYTSIVVLLSRGRIDVLRKLYSKHFLISRIPNKLNYLTKYIVLHTAEIIGRIGDIELFDMILARFIDDYTVTFKIYTQIYAYYYDNIKLAEQLIGYVTYQNIPIVADYLKHVSTPNGIISNLKLDYVYGELVSWHIGRLGLFESLNKIMSINPDNFYLENVIVAAMNMNNRVFLKQILNKSEIKLDIFGGLLTSPIYADPLTWELVANQPAFQNPDNDLVKIEWMEYMWIGNRYDSIRYLTKVFGNFEMPGSPGTEGTKLLQEYRIKEYT